jgi:hypothetical protein
MTNGDKIRQMSNEELAKYIFHNSFVECCDFCIENSGHICHGDCEKGIKAYLDMEVEE